MDPVTIQDAARLAAKVPRHTALSPRDGEIGPVWLDLRNERHAVALGRAGSVADALGACLTLQESACLFVTCGQLSIDAVAKRLAASLVMEEQRSLGVAAIRGEDVLGRIEEFFVAGCDLRNELPPHRLLRDSTEPPLVAIASVPAAALNAAIESGAKIIVSRTAEPETIRAALGPDPPGQPSGRVAIKVPTGCEAHAVLPGGPPAESVSDELTALLPSEVSWALTEANGLHLLRLRSPSRDALLEACRWCHLLLPGITTRLADSIIATTEGWPTSVLSEMLEFGYDLRPANDWLVG